MVLWGSTRGVACDGQSFRLAAPFSKKGGGGGGGQRPFKISDEALAGVEAVPLVEGMLVKRRSTAEDADANGDDGGGNRISVGSGAAVLGLEQAPPLGEKPCDRDRSEDSQPEVVGIISMPIEGIITQVLPARSSLRAPKFYHRARFTIVGRIEGWGE